MSLLISEVVLKSRDKGSYFIPQYKLVEMSLGELDAAKEVINTLIQAHPEYEWTFIEDRPNFGYTIRWEKIRQ